jgi:glycine cleavage system aminomethyltransferase T
MSAVQAGGGMPESRARRAAKHLVTAPDGQVGEIVVQADPAGAAHLMREIVARYSFDVALEEHEGHWLVVVRTGPQAEEVLAKVVDVTAWCVEAGRMAHATLCVGKRSYTIRPVGCDHGTLTACAA